MQGLDDSKFLPNLVRIDIIKFSQGGNKDNKKSKNKLIIPKILSTIKVPRENVLPYMYYIIIIYITYIRMENID